MDTSKIIWIYNVYMFVCIFMHNELNTDMRCRYVQMQIHFGNENNKIINVCALMFIIYYEFV